MCGIVGVVSSKEVNEKLFKGLTNLEYRGYDSVGMCFIHNNKFNVKKGVGKLEEVHKKVDFLNSNGNVGIGHCRWSTHGGVTEDNTHPHFDCSNKIGVVHNGIIENYSELKEELKKKGHKFSSETDTEVIAHLIEENLKENKIEEAVRLSLNKIEGSYALGVLFADEPEKLIGARNESPLILGIGNNENFIASDVPSILSYTNKIIYLEDKEFAVLTKEGHKVFGLDGNERKQKVHTINWSAEAAQKGGYKHFMLKEIYEQPSAITDTLNGRLMDGNVAFEDEFSLSDDFLKKIDRIVIVACGTSWHSALVGEFMFEELAKIPTEVEYASEFRYRHPILSKNTLVIAVSQSGETADTNSALKEAKKYGVKTLSICNVFGSSMTRISDGVIYTRAGPEIGVASTKAFTTQLTVLYLLTIMLSKIRKALNEDQIKSMIEGIRRIPLQLQSVLDEDKEILKCAELYHKNLNSLYLGRGINFPIALEGALKLKEVSYIHAEGYPAAEMKHGPIALIDKNMPVVFVAPHDAYTHKKILGNIEEVKARGGIIISIVTSDEKEIQKISDHTIFIPKTLYSLSSILSIVPLQLLAYHISVLRGLDVDRPRNLAKSCTVE
ncbi:glutamine--fructose-6-phosphate transaminase (isomerizing) [Candidatus Woesearchaeota archaeon]|jgi:glucosamine--fructose-6-phosphate aminotransferase (isomerizing)|nr:glutamine--fructose-6-phosphate transaminase (isomerizing) [Candidatus Woesearchaeota archaeon]|tara:strand:- start:2606 stop:4438 length:1833 start_codon:yes stop_codon:yes gene_type:complete